MKFGSFRKIYQWSDAQDRSVCVPIFIFLGGWKNGEWDEGKFWDTRSFLVKMTDALGTMRSVDSVERRTTQ